MLANRGKPRRLDLSLRDWAVSDKSQSDSEFSPEKKNFVFVLWLERKVQIHASFWHVLCCALEHQTKHQVLAHRWVCWVILNRMPDQHDAPAKHVHLAYAFRMLQYRSTINHNVCMWHMHEVAEEHSNTCQIFAGGMLFMSEPNHLTRSGIWLVVSQHTKAYAEQHDIPLEIWLKLSFWYN